MVLVLVLVLVLVDIVLNLYASTGSKDEAIRVAMVLSLFLSLLSFLAGC